MGSKENLIECERGSNWYIKSMGLQFKSRRMHRRKNKGVKQNDGQ